VYEYTNIFSRDTLKNLLLREELFEFESVCNYNKPKARRFSIYKQFQITL
jgi:hypothetical protein